MSFSFENGLWRPRHIVPSTGGRAALDYSARQRLDHLLRDGNTVCAYRAGWGLTGTANASAWASYIGDTKYLALPGAAGNGVTANAITLTNCDLIFYVAANDWTPGASGVIWENGSATEGALFYIESTGKLRCYLFASTDIASTAAPTVTDFSGTWVRFRFINNTGGGNYLARYYTSTDSVDTPRASISWSQLGSDVTGASLTPNTPSGSMWIGYRAVAGGGNLTLTGRVYRGMIFDGPSDTTGTLVRDFDASRFSVTSTNGATAAAATGETWTLANTGTTLACIETSPTLVQATGASQPAINPDGSLTTVATATNTGQYMQTLPFLLNQPATAYFAIRPTYGKAWVQAYLSGVGGDVNWLYNAAGNSNVALYAGVGTTLTAGPAENNTHVFASVINGVNSGLSADGGVPVTGSSGGTNPSGVTLAASLIGTLRANATFYEVIVRNVADTAAKQAQIINDMRRTWN